MLRQQLLLSRPRCSRRPRWYHTHGVGVDDGGHVLDRHWRRKTFVRRCCFGLRGVGLGWRSWFWCHIVLRPRCRRAGAWASPRVSGPSGLGPYSGHRRNSSTTPAARRLDVVLYFYLRRGRVPTPNGHGCKHSNRRRVAGRGSGSGVG